MEDSVLFDRLVGASNWAAFCPEDRSLYANYFSQPVSRFCYENNWAFICQEARLAAARYCDGVILSTLVAKHLKSPHIIMFTPYGNRQVFAAKAGDLMAQIHELTGKQVVLRRVPPDLRDDLLRSAAFVTVDATEFAFPCDVPEDVFPQVIVDTHRTSSLVGTGLQPIRNHINHLRRIHRIRSDDLRSVGKVGVESLITRWSVQHHERMTHQGNEGVSQADASAYTIFLNLLNEHTSNADYFGQALYLDENLSGFAFAGRTTAECASLYASLCVIGVRGAAETLMVDILHDLKDAGIRYLNLGGAETKGLFDFKRKFGPVELIKTYDMKIVGTNTITKKQS